MVVVRGFLMEEDLGSTVFENYFSGFVFVYSGGFGLTAEEDRMRIKNKVFETDCSFLLLLFFFFIFPLTNKLHN